EQLEREKGIKKEELLLLIETAIVSAYKKQHGKDTNTVAHIDPETGAMEACVVKMVVASVEKPLFEISLEDASARDATAVIGSEIRIPLDVNEFSRIAAQTARQVVAQKIKEKEKEAVISDYSKRIGEILSGNVFKFANRTIILDIGKTEAMLPPEEQIPGERFSVGKHIRAVLVRIEETPKGAQIILSRRDPLFVQKLFELEIPEIYEKIVEIIRIEREPGMRTKMVVDSKNPRVDAVGACIGVRGARIRPIIEELNGEKIDLIHNTRDAFKLIEEAMSPAKNIQISVRSVEDKTVEVIVPDAILSLAIGRTGHNVRLASKITGWNLVVTSESVKKQRDEEKANDKVAVVSKIKGIGEKTSEVLAKAGFGSVQKIAEASVDELTTLQGIGPKTAEKIIAAAKKAMTAPEDAPEEKTAEANAEEKEK
ncbi:MAG: transcription termination factor NusA, partial [Endomicrobiia bacterium]|nr:transcription termination factor NusA [Endomicrobiia bacterium]